MHRLLWEGNRFRLAPARRPVVGSCCLSTGNTTMSPASSDIPYGTLDLMVPKTLATLGPLHGYAIARRIEQMAEGSLSLHQRTIYPALLRLEQKRWIASRWGLSENNRQA